MFRQDSSWVPIVKQVPIWNQTGKIEDKLFSSSQDLESRINDKFIRDMSIQFNEDKIKYEERIKLEDEERKVLFLKKKWFKIVDSLNKNYDIDLVNMDEELTNEIKRCILIPSAFMRTKLEKECIQCSKKLWENQEQYKPVRHPNDETFDFDGHFPSDHIKLHFYKEKTDSQKSEYIGMKSQIDFNCPYTHMDYT